MKRASRILISAPALLILLSATPAITAPVAELDAPTRRITVVAGSEDRRDAVDWAVAHFDDAGLELPELAIAIHDSDEPCGGFDGVFRSRETPAQLDICNTHRLIILHELAHAWDHHSLTNGLRQDFMDLRGLAAWDDGDTPWKERGVEDLAEVVVWGLRQLSGSAEFDEQPDKATAFGLITGIDLPNDPVTVQSATKTSAESDRLAEDTDWDTLH